MRFMYIVTSPQPNRYPNPALMEAIQKLADREIKAGRMIDSGGLMPVATGAQVKIAEGKLFAESRLGRHGVIIMPQLKEFSPRRHGEKQR